MNLPKFIRYPFATTGDKTSVPDDVEPGGNISYAEGYGFDYERNPATDPQAKRIERDKMNQLHHDITSNIQQYQLYATPWFYDASVNGGTPVAYPKGAFVRYKDGIEEKNYVSLVDNNTAAPTDSKKWTVIDDTAYAMRNGSRNYVVADGDGQAITGTLDLPFKSFVAGFPIVLKVKYKNESNPTLNINNLGPIPIVYNQTGESVREGDFQPNDLLFLVFDGSRFRLDPTMLSMDRRYSKLTQPPSDTFYVIGPNGNDNNTGFSTSPAEGFRTIMGAINAINNRYMTSGTVTIRVSPGTYDGFLVPNSMVANWVIKSLNGDKKSVRVFATDPNKTIKNACSTFFGTQVDIADMTLAGVYDTIATTQGTINVYNCDIMMGNASNSQAVACYGGSINLFGDITISGSGYVIFHATSCGSLGLGYYDVNGKSPLTITYKDAKASWATFVCEKCSNVSVASAVVTFIGVPDSMSYTASDNGIINTWGAGTNIFPGTRAPWVGSGGIAN